MPSPPSPATKGERVHDTPERGDAGAVRRFSRIIPAPIPTRADFLADAAVGKAPPRDPGKVRYWRGLSVFETSAQARAIATRNGRATWSIAAVTIPDNGPIPDERWGRNDGHHTLWGDPDYLFQCVTAVAPVTPERE